MLLNTRRHRCRRYRWHVPDRRHGDRHHHAEHRQRQHHGVLSGIAALDISTGAGATAAITALDTAISTVSTTRGNLGALQNRFESMINNLQVTTENLSASESRIRDTDMAAEMVTFTKNQVLPAGRHGDAGSGEPDPADDPVAPALIGARLRGFGGRRGPGPAHVDGRAGPPSTNSSPRTITERPRHQHRSEGGTAMSNSISFTAGGIDVSSIVTALMDVERAPITTLQTRQAKPSSCRATPSPG